MPGDKSMALDRESCIHFPFQTYDTDGRLIPPDEYRY
jgi:hypothetical protein